MPLSHIVSLLLMSSISVLAHGDHYYADNEYPSYNASALRVCHNFTFEYPFGPSSEELDYPVQPECKSDIPAISAHCDGTYRILRNISKLSSYRRAIRIADAALFDHCSPLSDDNSFCFMYTKPGQDKYESRSMLGSSVFKLSDEYRLGTIINCSGDTSQSLKGLQQIQCMDCERRNNSCFFSPGRYSLYMDDCSLYTIVIPANKNYNISAEKNLRKFLQKGFDLQWTISDACLSCQASNGRCYSNGDIDKLHACICADGPHRNSCYDGNPIFMDKPKSSMPVKTIAVICGVVFVIFAMAAASIFILLARRRSSRKRKEEEREMRAYMDPLDSTTPPSLDSFLHGGMPTRYSYYDIKRYTNNFAYRLGQGGFGTVYKGRLPNECYVAIKVLNESKQRQKQFLSEVVTIGRIHHIHLVRLLGYCFEGSKRALVYEYMAKGSLEKYIHRHDDERQNALDWKQLYGIAIGTARGIAYLHDECRSRILHCDIKPHNVLLDDNFVPKVADFGLAKLTDREKSHVSLTCARGTPGYLAPEMWSRNHGAVTDRSDVYSYGMLLMEMVGKRKNFDMEANRSSQFYYPEWAFKQVENGEFNRLREGSVENAEDENMVKKLSLVGLWCIQYHVCHRPSMSKVIEMLEGSIKISVPPLPFPVDSLMHTPVSASTGSSSSTNHVM